MSIRQWHLAAGDPPHYRGSTPFSGAEVARSQVPLFYHILLPHIKAVLSFRVIFLSWTKESAWEAGLMWRVCHVDCLKEHSVVLLEKTAALAHHCSVDASTGLCHKVRLCTPDLYSSTAFRFIEISDLPEAAVPVVHDPGAVAYLACILLCHPVVESVRLAEIERCSFHCHDCLRNALPVVHDA